MIKAGRYTAAVLLVAVGVLLLVDQTGGGIDIAGLLQWWPAILILLGIEYMILAWVTRSSGKRLRIDVWSLIVAVVIAVVGVGFTHDGKLSLRSLGDWSFPWDMGAWSGESGHKFDRGVTRIPLAQGTGKVSLTNANGSVIVKPGDGPDLEVQMTVWVDKNSADDASAIAEQTVLTYTEGAELQIETKSESYKGFFGMKRKPHVNLVVTVPAGIREADFALHSTNGKLEAADLTVKHEFVAITSNGSVQLSNLTGDARLESNNGSVKAAMVSGRVDASTTNGAIDVRQAGGAVAADTTNGKITIIDAGGSVDARTTNGTIRAVSATVAGDWTLETTNGGIEAYVPADASVSVHGETTNGGVSTDLPLTAGKREINGSLGAGTYKLELSTTNSGIAVRNAASAPNAAD